MEMRRLGVNGPIVSAVGLGCMGMSDFYGPADERESIATIHEAIDRGVTLLNTGDFYGMGHNELLIARAIEGRRDRVFLSVKFGALRSPSMAFIGFDARPAAVKTFLTYSLKRLKTDYVDLYQPARVDPSVPIEETIGAMAEMVQAGYVRHLGLSEAAAGDGPAGERGPPDRGAGDRVCGSDSRDRGRDAADAPRAGNRDRGLRRPVARLDRRPGTGARNCGGSSGLPPTLPGRQPRREREAG